MELTANPREQVGWTFWLQWVLVNSIGWAVGLGMVSLSGHLIYVVGPASPPVKGVPPPPVREVAVWGLHNPIVGVIFGVLAGAICGALLGIVQQSVLHRSGFSVRWTLGSAMGWAIGIGLGEFLHMHPLGIEVEGISGIPPIENLLKLEHPFLLGAWLHDVTYLKFPIAVGATFGILGGLLAVLMQWLALRQQFKRAGWWLLANSLGSILGWAIGVPLGLIVSYFVSLMSSWYRIAYMPLLMLWGVPAGIVTGAVVGALNGAFTGLPLFWQLRPPSLLTRAKTA